MSLQQNNYIKIMNETIDISEIPSFKSAKLIYVKGKGALTKETKVQCDSYYGYTYLSQMKLNGVPLLNIHAPACPTCTSLLAAGHGIDKANCQELVAIREAINSSFTTLDDSITSMEPLLTLLQSGLYVIADAICYPTDGENFFWNVDNTLKESSATAPVYIPESDYTYISRQPVYIYPTQNSSCYDEKRVEYYVDLFQKTVNVPRAIVYNFDEFISFVLDGHHKACAAALTGKPLNSIVIIPFGGYGYQNVENEMIPSSLYFSSINIPADMVAKEYLPTISNQENRHSEISIKIECMNSRDWEKEYIISSKKYPSLIEYAEMVAAGIIFDEYISDETINNCLSDLTVENQIKLKSILNILYYRNDKRLCKVAMECASMHELNNLKKLAYKRLLIIKDDSIEKFFIDYIVNNEDKTDPILSIIYSYWE